MVHEACRPAHQAQ